MKTPCVAGLMLCSCHAYAEININQLDWMVINDSVMGGISQSKVVIDNNALTFKGAVSLANNGGFASFRAPYSFENSNIDRLNVTVQGDGKTYQLRLRVDGYYDGPAFVYKFKTKPGEQQVFKLTEQDFVLMFRGRTFKSEYQFKFSDVRAIGFMISSKQSGQFKLDVKQLAVEQKI